MPAEFDDVNESYLIFSVQKRFYSIKTSNVQEIMHSAKIHPLPFVPKYIEGMVNCRGVPYTVINLLKLEDIEDSDMTNRPVLVFRRDDDQFALLISSIELFFEPEKEDVLEDGIKYKTRVIPFFDADSIEATLRRDLREDQL